MGGTCWSTTQVASVFALVVGTMRNTTSSKRGATSSAESENRMSKWLVVQPDGTVLVREDELVLDAMQEAVQGELEALPSPITGVTMFVNKDRLDWRSQQPLLLNPKATALMANSLWPGQRIVGPMILAGLPSDPDEDEESAFVDLSDEQVASLQEKLT